MLSLLNLDDSISVRMFHTSSRVIEYLTSTRPRKLMKGLLHPIYPLYYFSSSSTTTSTSISTSTTTAAAATAATAATTYAADVTAATTRTRTTTFQL